MILLPDGRENQPQQPPEPPVPEWGSVLEVHGFIPNIFERAYAQFHDEEEMSPEEKAQAADEWVKENDGTHLLCAKVALGGKGYLLIQHIVEDRELGWAEVLVLAGERVKAEVLKRRAEDGN